MKTDCLERPIKKVFSSYGRIVATQPVPFVIVPLVIAFACGFGFMFLEKETDVEYLFTPLNSDTRQIQQHLKAIYGETTTDTKFDPDRSLNQQILSRAIITPTGNNTNLLNQPLSTEISNLDNFIQAITVDDDSYTAICAKYNGVCVTHGWDLVTSGLSLTYPVTSITGMPKISLGSLLSDVKTDNNGTITSVGAVHLTYFLANHSNTRAWETKFIKEILDKEFENIDAVVWTFNSIEDELAENTKRIVPYFSITFTILITFSINACVLQDPVKTKPFLGFCGVLSAGLAVVTAFGVLMYAGMPFIDIVAASPFLAIGIGVDDMFVMLAAWRKTSAYRDVKERMGEAFGDAAMSITITTITDVLAIAIGAITPFPSVKIFCAYMGLTLLFDYIFQITFFAGILALTGRREAANRHAWTCMKIQPRSEAGQQSQCYINCCMGGVSHEGKADPKDNKEPMMMIFFRDKFSKFINALAAKIVIIILWVIYLGFAIWGCLNIKEGIDLNNLAPDDSYVTPFYQRENEYFTTYTFPVQVIVQTKVESSHIASQIEKLIDEYESSEFFHGSELTESWLRDFQKYTSDRGHDIAYTNIFDDTFQAFINDPGSHKYKNDFASGNTVTRYILRTANIDSTVRETQLLSEAREIANKYPDLMVDVFSPRFIFTEQYIAVLPNTLQNLGIAAASMLIVSLLLIPHPLVSIYVVLSIVSITVGVIGYMTHWQVNLDTVSMINLIMCIGFCVDFSAHITYAFVTSSAISREVRVKDALYTLGLPILQGSISTILGVIVLAFSFAYIFRTFFKVMFLVILLGSLHGLFVLPVFLSLIGPKGSGKEDSYSANNKTNRVDVQLGSKSESVVDTVPETYEKQNIN